MSVIRRQFGSFMGNSDEDLRIQVKGPGVKNALVCLVSWERTTHVSFDAASFNARLIILEGECPISADIDVSTNLANFNRIILDLTMTNPGPHQIILPLTNLEGNLEASAGGTLTIVACRAQTAIAAETFVPKLTVAGQAMSNSRQHTYGSDVVKA